MAFRAMCKVTGMEESKGVITLKLETVPMDDNDRDRVAVPQASGFVALQSHPELKRLLQDKEHDGRFYIDLTPVELARPTPVPAVPAPVPAAPVPAPVAATKEEAKAEAKAQKK